MSIATIVLSVTTIFFLIMMYVMSFESVARQAKRKKAILKLRECRNANRKLRKKTLALREKNRSLENENTRLLQLRKLESSSTSIHLTGRQRAMKKQIMMQRTGP